MEMGPKIRLLRNKASLTQEQLAGRLGVSPQAVSKWENAAAMPDIALLPALAEVFGVSIDELFDLTDAQKLSRIENRMMREEELEPALFREYEGFLREKLREKGDRLRPLSLLAHLYHHRLEADARKAAKLAREAILAAPEKKDCQWLLQRTEGAVAWDWNISNHHRVIAFYEEVIQADRGEPKSPLPYYYLLDNLIADRRTVEARAYLRRLQTLPGHKPCLIPVYEAHILLAECEKARADAVIEEALRAFPGNSDMLFEAAQYYARACAYDRAIECYEASFAAEAGKKPRFSDALQGIAAIHEIRGEYEEAAATHRRILTLLKTEWGCTEETCIRDTEREVERLEKKATQ